MLCYVMDSRGITEFKTCSMLIICFQVVYCVTVFQGHSIIHTGNKNSLWRKWCRQNVTGSLWVNTKFYSYY